MKEFERHKMNFWIILSLASIIMTSSGAVQTVNTIGRDDKLIRNHGSTNDGKLDLIFPESKILQGTKGGFSDRTAWPSYSKIGGKCDKKYIRRGPIYHFNLSTGDAFKKMQGEVLTFQRTLKCPAKLGFQRTQDQYYGHENAKKPLLGFHIKEQHSLEKPGSETRDKIRTRRDLRSYTLQATRGLPQFVFTPIEQTVSPGSPVSLKCSAVGPPMTTITWNRDGAMLIPSLRTNIGNIRRDTGEVVSFVNITNVIPRDGGLFTCKAANSFGMLSHSSRLNVYGPPFVRPMRNVSATAGQNTRIWCPVGGYPLPNIEWQFNGQMVPVNLRQEIEKDNTLIIKNAEEADQGRYTCIATGRKGRSAISETYLHIAYPPVIERILFSEDLQEGRRTHLTCMVTSGDLPMVIHWIKNGLQLPHDPLVKQKQISDYSMILLFERLSDRHTGNYTCVAKNAADSANSTAFVKVKVSPKWIFQPSDISVTVGSPVRIDCLAKGVPTPQSNWLKASYDNSPTDFQPVAFNGQKRRSRNGTLYFPQIKKEDGGSYLCKIENGVGSSLSKIFKINVNAKPLITSDGGKSVGHIGNTVTFKCEATGDIPIQFTWRKNNKRISFTSRFTIQEPVAFDGPKKSELSIKWLQSSDKGSYMCQAKNSYGIDSKIYHLNILEPPIPPRDIKLTKVTSRTASISWKIRTPTGLILQYKLSKYSWNKNGRNISIGGEHSSYVLHKLLPFNAYQTRLFSTNDLGVSEPSNVLQFSTKEEAPSSPPMEVTVSSIEPKSLHVTWKPPATSGSNGHIRGYVIAYKEQNMGEQFSFITRPVHSTDRSAVESYYIKQLKPNTLYEVAVKSFNRMGNGPLSSPRVVQETLQDVPECPPIGVSCRSDPLAGIRGWWEPPRPSCLRSSVTEYLISATPTIQMGGKEYRTMEVRTTNLEKNLQSVPYANNISVTLAAINKQGHGPISKNVFCLTKNEVPMEVRNVRAIVLHSLAVIVVWEPPQVFKGKILKYSVYYERLGKIESLIISGEDILKTWRAIEGFQLSDKVQIWVTATTTAGEGKSSPRISIILTVTNHAPIAVGSKGMHKVTQNSGITLSCVGFGSSANFEERWLIDESPVVNDDSHHLMTGNELRLLAIKSANYTCSVRNNNGRDSFMAQVIVLTTPSAPQMNILGSSYYTINVSLFTEKNGGLPILGYKIFYREDGGAWIDYVLSPSPRNIALHVTLRNIKCGSSVHIYATSWNGQGSSLPSSVIVTATKGSAPPKPNSSKVLELNSTCVIIRFYEWPELGCQISSWMVEVKAEETENWESLYSMVDRDSRDIALCNGELETNHFIKLTAKSQAGTTAVAYKVNMNEITTGFMSGSQVQEITLESRLYMDTWIDAHIIAGIISALLLLMAIVICSVVLIKKRHEQRQNTAHDSKAADTYKSEGMNNFHSYSPPASIKKMLRTKRKRSQPSIGSFVSYDSETLHPYATFSPKNATDSIKCAALMEIDSSQCDNNLDEYNYKDELHERSRQLLPISRSSDQELIYIASNPCDVGKRDVHMNLSGAYGFVETTTETLPLRSDQKKEPRIKRQHPYEKMLGKSEEISPRHKSRVKKHVLSERLPHHSVYSDRLSCQNEFPMSRHPQDIKMHPMINSNR